MKTPATLNVAMKKPAMAHDSMKRPATSSALVRQQVGQAWQSLAGSEGVHLQWCSFLDAASIFRVRGLSREMHLRTESEQFWREIVETQWPSAAALRAQNSFFGSSVRFYQRRRQLLQPVQYSPARGPLLVSKPAEDKALEWAMLVELCTNRRSVLAGLFDVVAHEELVMGPGLVANTSPERAGARIGSQEIDELSMSLMLVRRCDGFMMSVCSKARPMPLDESSDAEVELMFDVPEPTFPFRDDEDSDTSDDETDADETCSQHATRHLFL